MVDHQWICLQKALDGDEKLFMSNLSETIANVWVLLHVLNDRLPAMMLLISGDKESIYIITFFGDYLNSKWFVFTSTRRVVDTFIG